MPTTESWHANLSEIRLKFEDIFASENFERINLDCIQNV